MKNLKKKCVSWLLTVAMLLSMTSVTAWGDVVTPTDAAPAAAEQQDSGQAAPADNAEGAETPAQGSEAPDGDEAAEGSEPTDGDEAPAAEEPAAEGSAAGEEPIDGEEPALATPTDWPAFSDSVTVEGVTVSVVAPAGVFPAEAALSVTAVAPEDAPAVDEAVEGVRDEGRNVAAAYTFDVKVLDGDGNELQPADGALVKVTFVLARVGDGNLDTAVYHVAEDERGDLAAEALPTREAGNTVSVTTDGFSYYTVEFTYGELQYVLPGDGSVALPEIMEAVGLTGEVETLRISDTSLFDAELIDRVWYIRALQPFTSEEWLRLTIDGVTYEITVTDDANIEIGTLAELKKIGVDGDYPLNGNYKLTADIGVMDAMIGGQESTFTGVFDGDGHTITLNLSADNWNTALFSKVTGTVKNLKTAGSVTSSNGNAAGIISDGSGTGKIENCWNTATVTGVGSVTVGGIIAHTGVSTFIVSNCCNTGIVSHDSGDNLNGIVGYHHGQIISCFSANNGIARINASDSPGSVTSGYYIGVRGTGTTGTQVSGDAITNTNSYSGLDFENTWVMTADGPRLRVFAVATVGDAQYFSLADAVSNWSAGSTLMLLTDVTAGSTISVPSGDHTLDLNGFGIKMAGSGSVISVGSGATLTLNDSNPSAEHRFTVADAAANGAGLATVNDSATGDGVKTFTGGYITGGNKTGDGGGICVSSNGYLVMNGGTIIGNQTQPDTGYGGKGGGIFVNDSPEEVRFTMTGGAVMYNKTNGSNGWGGGVNVSAKVVMSGGTIAYNYAAPGVGGLHCHNLTMTGGSIENNYANATGQAGGVSWDNTLEVSGAPVISGNRNQGGINNVNRNGSNKYITVTGALGEGASIGVTMASTTGVFTNSTDTAYNDASKFFSDNDSYTVGKNADGQLLLGAPVSVSYSTAHGTAPTGGTVASGSAVTLPAAPSADGWDFTGWKTGDTTYDAENTVTVTGATTFTAQWSALPATAPTISGVTGLTGDAALTYGYGSGNSISVSATAATDTTYNELSYQWYSNTTNSNSGGSAITGATSASYEFPTGKDADTYYYYCVVTATRTGNGETASATSGVATVTVNKADPIADAPTGVTADYGQTLANVTLTNPSGNTAGSWAWVNTGTSVGDAGSHSFPANFTPSDTTNYNAKSNVSVNVTVNKVDGTQPTVTANNRTYDSTEQPLLTVSGTASGGEMQYKLSGGSYSTTVPVATDADSYTVYYRFVGDGNHNDVTEQSISVTVGRADMSDSVNATSYSGFYDAADHSITVTAPDGATVTYSTDGTNYVTANPSYKDVTGGAQTVYYKVTKANYNDVTRTATVNVLPKAVTITAKDAGKTYDGSALTQSGFEASALESGDDHEFTVVMTAGSTITNYGTQPNVIATVDGVAVTTGTATAVGNYSVTTVNGELSIEPASVTLTANSNIWDYTGDEQTLTGFTPSVDGLKFASTVTASGSGTDVGTYDVTFSGVTVNTTRDTTNNYVVTGTTDGTLTIRPIDATVTAPGEKALRYTGESQELVTAGTPVGGTLYYALGADGATAPTDGWSTTIPAATEVGSYYVWYKVTGDKNHNDLAPAFVKVTLAEQEWIDFTGTVYQSDGTTGIPNVTVILMQGTTEVDRAVTDGDGNYHFTVKDDVYNVVVVSGDTKVTQLLDAEAGGVCNVVMPDGNTKSELKVNPAAGGQGDTTEGLVVGGLDAEAGAVRTNDNVAPGTNVTVTMTVEEKTADTATGSAAIQVVADGQELEYMDIKVEKTVGTVTTTLESTANILEIVVPYSFTGKEFITVYRYHDGVATALQEADTKADGTFRLDKVNGFIYIYTNKFSSYGIGFTPCFNAAGAIQYGKFAGQVTVSLLDQQRNVIATYDSDMTGGAGNYAFTHIPKGAYYMTVSWTENGKQITVEKQIDVN